MLFGVVAYKMRPWSPDRSTGTPHPLNVDCIGLDDEQLPL